MMIRRFLLTLLAALAGAGLYHLFGNVYEGDGLSRASSDLNDKYGSPEDFKKAIEELRRLLPDEDAVSTDAAHLEEHGFSENDYHPGTCSVFC